MLRVLSLSFRKSVWIGNVQNFCWLFLAVVQWFGVRDFSLYGKSITVCVFVSVTKRNEYPPTLYPKQVLKIVSAKFRGELVPGIHCGPHTLSLLQFFLKRPKTWKVARKSSVASSSSFSGRHIMWWHVHWNRKSFFAIEWVTNFVLGKLSFCWTKIHTAIPSTWNMFGTHIHR